MSIHISLLTGLKAEDVENIVNVRLLDLRENKITQLPDEITCLQLLERLDVSNNDLSGLPFVLGLEFFELYCKFLEILFYRNFTTLEVSTIGWKPDEIYSKGHYC